MNRSEKNTQLVAVQEDVQTNSSPSVSSIANQHEEETNLQVQASTFDFEEYNHLVSQAGELKKKEAKMSIVPKYYEFKRSLEAVLQDAEKKKGKEKEQYLEMAIEDTKTQGFYQGIEMQEISHVNKETGEVTTKKREVVRWIGADGLCINFGSQLIRAFKQANIALGTPVEIQFMRKEAVKSTEGASVKIYEIYPLI